METMLFIQVDDDDKHLVENAFEEASIYAGIPDDLVEVAKGATVISTFIDVPFDAETLKKLPALKLLCTRSVGYDHIDLEYCSTHGITVCHVPDYGSHVIAEHVFALLLARVRHIYEADQKVESGHFDYHDLRGISLKGKTIGIAGTGKIGRQVARIAHGFDMRIIATDHCRTVSLEEDFGVVYVPLKTLLSESDILTLHFPATPHTHHLLNADAFSS